MPSEDFTALNRVSIDQSSAFTHELNLLSEQPARTPITGAQTEQHLQQSQQAQPGQNHMWWQAEAPAQKDQHAIQQSSSQHLPEVTLHDSEQAKPKSDWSKTANLVADIGIAAAAVAAAEALGAVILRSPKLAEAAAETVEASTPLDVFATKTAFAIGKLAVYEAAFSMGVGARHYGYRALTGHNESWSDSTFQTMGGFAIYGGAKLRNLANRKF